MDTFAEMAAKVEGMVTPRRWRHILGVMETAEELAIRQNCSREGARVAALLHDCAKDLPKNTLLKLIEDSGIVLDEVEGELYPLWHAPVGAVLARREFGVTDLDILAAIRYHTVGRAGMSLLEKSAVADITNPVVPRENLLLVLPICCRVPKALDSAITFITAGSCYILTVVLQSVDRERRSAEEGTSSLRVPAESMPNRSRSLREQPQAAELEKRRKGRKKATLFYLFLVVLALLLRNTPTIRCSRWRYDNQGSLHRERINGRTLC